MKTKGREMFKQIDQNLAEIKKQILSGDLTLDAEAKAILTMLKVQIEELTAIAMLVTKS